MKRLTLFSLFTGLFAGGLCLDNSRPATMHAKYASNRPAQSQSPPKYVFAHHMVGNTHPYTMRDWADDIALAHANGIDAFALNIGSDAWQQDRVADAYNAAAQSNTGFKMFLSFDMTVFPCASPPDALTLVNYTRQHQNHPAQFIYPPGSSKAFTSTFSGEKCTFGQSSPAAGWTSQFKNTLGDTVYFVPSLFSDPASFQSDGFGTVMDGDFNWNSAWPVGLTNPPPPNEVQSYLDSFDADNQHITGLKTIGSNKTYMAAASPWFFTHYSPQTFDKNWIYFADLLYPTRWETLISHRDVVDIVEVITWNDYGESHYIGPIKGDQPNSQAWVDGFDHTAWLDLTKYYATAFKSGSYPSITTDKIYAWARPHPKDANAPDPVGKPDHYDLGADSLFVVVMATQPSTVVLSASDGYPSTSKTQTFSVPQGVTNLSLPLSTGDVMRAKMIRGSQTVAELPQNNFTFNGSPTTYNYNAYVIMATSG
ncbi:glycoside hydrolase [Rickenella mellea]|uniref:Glycoside hydrolase n=1 Tax=Rickenella mellea TaxID=50990 RepID=A0A4Y7QF58_9AGAM|nr:glycoside hydrolase [Rickenella mellea]